MFLYERSVVVIYAELTRAAVVRSFLGRPFGHSYIVDRPTVRYDMSGCGISAVLRD